MTHTLHISSDNLAGMLDRLRLTKDRYWTGTFVSSANVLIASSVGDTMSVSANAVTIKGDLPERVTIPLGVLDKWFKRLKGDVEISHDDQMVTFTCGDAVLPIRTLADAHNLLPEEPKAKFAVPAGVWDAIRQVASFASNDRDRPVLSHVHLRGGKVMATDSYRLGQVTVKGLKRDISLDPTIVKILDRVDLDVAKVLVDDRNRLHVSEPDGRFVVSGYEDDPPKVDGLWSMEGRQELRVNRKDLIDAVKHLAGVRMSNTTPVAFKTDGDYTSLILSVETADESTATRTLPCEGYGAATFGFNPTYLAETLSSLSDETVIFHMVPGKEKTMPVVFVEGDFAAVIMPVRIP